MKFLRLIPGIAFALVACGDAETSHEAVDSLPPVDTTIIIDTIAQQDTIPQVVIAAGLGGDTITVADQSLIFYSFTKKLSENKNKKLTVKQVRERFMPIDTSCDGEAAWKLKRFFVLDSLRKRGEEPDSDMGQVMKVEIREYDTIKKSPAGTWVVWTMWYETSQSCPYASGTYFMLSTYNAAGTLVSTQCMGRDEGGADAPLTWSTVQTSNIFTDGSFRSLLCDSVGDYMDDGSIEYSSIMRKTYTGTIAATGKILTTSKEIERNE